jgi:hypothetical protein
MKLLVTDTVFVVPARPLGAGLALINRARSGGLDRDVRSANYRDHGISRRLALGSAGRMLAWMTMRVHSQQDRGGGVLVLPVNNRRAG